MHITSNFPIHGRRTDEAEETILAIRQGSVDAFVVESSEGQRVYTLTGADLPYSVLVERMLQGAAMLNARGDIVYCNPSLADLLGAPRTAVVGIPLQEFLDEQDRRFCQELVDQARFGPTEKEMRLRHADGTRIPANFSFQLLSRETPTIGVLVTDLTAQKNHADLTARLQQIQDEERKRIARELHDSVGQLLASVAMNIDRVQQESHRLSDEGAKLVLDNAVMVDQVSREIRTISHLLHPPLLDIAGLASAIRWYADGFSERSKIEVDLQIPDELPRFSSEIEIAIFRMVQECLTNIHRHSGSPCGSIKISQEGQRLRIEISDSGHGIPKSKQSTFPVTGGVGLRGMHERLHQLGGTLEIVSSEKGTTVIAILPFAGE